MGYNQPVGATTVGRTGYNINQKERSHRTGVISPTSGQPVLTGMAAVASPNDALSKAPKILPYPLENLAKETIDLFARMDIVEIMIKTALAKNTVMPRNIREKIRLMKKRNLIAKRQIKEIYRLIAEITL